MTAMLKTVVRANNAANSLDIEQIRKDFPILRQNIRGKPLVYLDNAASCQKPQVVIDAIRQVYECDYANIHRGVHTLSERSTAAYEGTRKKVQRFINAESEKEIIFVRGTTEAINLVAQTYGKAKLGMGDEILITTMEHHSNIVPWQILCEQTGAVLKVGPINKKGELLVDEFKTLVNERTKLISIIHMSNALGTINPVKKLIEFAHDHNIPVLLDGAQAIPHMPVDVLDLDCDFYAFSGHKLYGPSGIGVLYGKTELLDRMPPYQSGGDMIRRVTFEKTEYAPIPYKFEAGTPNIADTIAFGVALDYLNSLGMDAIGEYECQLLRYATDKSKAIPEMTLIGTAENKGGILSFVLKNIHPHDIGTILDHSGIAVRAGHHCAMPVMDFFEVSATTRASFAVYNTFEEIDTLFEEIKQLIKVFGR